MSKRHLYSMYAMLAFSPLVSGCAVVSTPVVFTGSSGVLELKQPTETTWAVSLGEVSVPLTGAQSATSRFAMQNGTGSAMLVSSQDPECKDKLTLFAAGTHGLHPAELGCVQPWTLTAPDNGSLSLSVGDPAAVWTVENGDISPPVAEPVAEPEHVHVRGHKRVHHASRPVHEAAHGQVHTRSVSHVILPDLPAVNPFPLPKT